MKKHMSVEPQHMTGKPTLVQNNWNDYEDANYFVKMSQGSLSYEAFLKFHFYYNSGLRKP